MNLEIVIVVSVALHVILAFITSITIVINSQGYSTMQKTCQILFVCFVPIIGAILVISARRADRAEPLSAKEVRKQMKWKEWNESRQWF